MKYTGNEKIALTVEETANALSLTPKAIYMLVYRRKISFVKLGKRVLIPMSSIRHLLDSNLISPLELKKKDKKGE